MKVILQSFSKNGKGWGEICNPWGGIRNFVGRGYFFTRWWEPEDKWF